MAEGLPVGAVEGQCMVEGQSAAEGQRHTLLSTKPVNIETAVVDRYDLHGTAAGKRPEPGMECSKTGWGDSLPSGWLRLSAVARNMLSSDFLEDIPLVR